MIDENGQSMAELIGYQNYFIRKWPMADLYCTLQSQYKMLQLMDRKLCTYVCRYVRVTYICHVTIIHFVQKILE